jgi:protoporphyrinogen oxidase
MNAIIGAGITGLTAGMKNDAVIFEKNSEPGGVARSFCFDGFWFDNTVHFLPETPEINSEIIPLAPDVFKKTKLQVSIDTGEEILNYPFQLNLNGLKKEEIINCIADYVNAPKGFETYKDFLLASFGKTMCEKFFFPYNEKSWKYPLDKMVPSGQVWNVDRPDIKNILKGAFDIQIGGFNNTGYYPVPDKDYFGRGIGFLSYLIFNEAKLESEVLWIKDHNLVYRQNSTNQVFKFDKLLSTIPLPRLIGLCDSPESLRHKVLKLKWTKLYSVAISVVGERPDLGHYRYYSSPEIPFNKVTFMTEFDPYSAPPYGYGLLIEVKDEEPDLEKIIKCLRKAGVIKDKDVIVGKRSWVVDPAYVIFTEGTQKIIEDCREWLLGQGIDTLGRYGTWEYSSMAKNIKDGLSYDFS